jgi:Ca-activated chloride channel family protein
MSPRVAKVLWAVFSALLLGGMIYAYRKYVWLAPPGTFVRVEEGITYELLDPRMLGVALIAPWFVLMLGWTLADLPWQQRFLSALLRITFVSALAIALARPVRSAETDKITTVFMIDVSSSVSDESIADAQARVDEAFEKKRKDDVVRVITFARSPHLLANVLTKEGDEEGTEKPPTVARHEAPPDATPGPDGKVEDPGAGSNLQAALQYAYGLYGPGFLRRAVLISDGLQTDGDILAEANRAAEHGVKLHTIPYTKPVPPEVAVRELKLPDRVKVGETFTVKADVYASRDAKVKAQLKQGETLNGLEPLKEVELKAGSNLVEFQSVVRVAGEVTYALDLQIPKDQDRFPDNNRFSATIDVPGRPQVLYVEGAPRYAGPLSQALTAQQFDVDIRPASGFPGSIKELERFDFVVLSDVAAESVSLTSQQLIEQYVRDLGGGFLFAGGENGYGLGGWYNTTISRILPVHLETEKRREMPSVAMILVIDRSGSMTGLPLEMAKKAAAASAEVLSSDDVVEVIAFDGQPYRYVKMQPARNRSRIKNQISRIQPGGGTEIFPALDAAYNDMTVTDARKKHVILLTDGRAPTSGIRDLVTAMIADSITVTTVGLGGDVDEQLLKMIADVGGGRYHSVPDPQSLPRIFTKETEMISRAAAVEEWFPVVQTGYASFLKKIDVRTSPYLHGYVSTKMKAAPATELLASEDTEEPILARWRVGTGWSLAWTSDVKSRWALEWIGWPGWEKFWGQLVREHMRDKYRRELDMRSEIVGGELVATIDAFTLEEKFDNDMVSKLTVKGPEPGGETRSVPMRQIAPGRYEARVPMDKYGSFLLHAEHAREEENGNLKPVAVSSGHVSNPYPREYAEFKTDTQTLERAALATKGQYRPEDLAVAFDPEGEKITSYEDLWMRLVMASIAVFIVDLFLRRVRLFNRKFGHGRARKAA